MPNLLNELLADQYRRHLGELEDVVVIDYKGLDSELMATFRDELRKADLTMEVVKNRIAMNALKDSGLKPLVEEEANKDNDNRVFRGQTAFLFGGESTIDVAKFATKWIKAHKDSIEVKGGQMGPDVLDKAGVQEVAKLPSKEELLSQMASGFLAVPQELAATMQAGYLQVAYAFQALATKLEE